MEKLSKLLKKNLVVVPLPSGSREEVLAAFADAMVKAGIVEEDKRETIFEALKEREKLASTSLGKGIAVPHAYVDCVSCECLAFGRTEKPVSFGGAAPGKTDLFFLLAGPSRHVSEHLQLLARTARLARDEEFVESLRKAKTADDVIQAFLEVEHRHH